VRSLGPNGFEPSGFERICLPSSVEVIGDHCFFKCRSLQKISFESNSRLKIAGVGGLDLSGSNWFAFPNGVTKVPEACFRDCEELQELKLIRQASMKCIHADVFSNLTLCSIIIPSGIEGLDQDVCQILYHLKEFHLNHHYQ
jgi:hypothetical protein